MNKIIPLRNDDFYRKKAEKAFEEAMICVSKQDYEGSLEHFRAAVQFCPDDGQYHFYTGLSLYITEELELSLPYLKRACELEKNEEFQHTYGIVLFRAGQYHEAVEIFKKGKTYESQFYLGKSYFELGKYSESIAIYDRLIEKEVKFDVLFEKGSSHFYANELKEAKASFELCKKMKKDYPLSYYYLSKVYVNQGKHKEAITVLEELKKELPEEVTLADKHIIMYQNARNIR